VTILPTNESREAAPWDAVGSRLARPIVVVSALSGGIGHGMTADSFTLVSRDPALVMLAVAAGGRTHRVLASAPGFAVSVLAEGQSAVATHFASRRRAPGLRQFDVVAWHAAPCSGAPVLADALTWLDCARRDLVAWLGKWQAKYPKLCEWVEGNIEETFTFYRLPKEHHKHLKSTNMLERLNQELKRRTHVIRIFPNPESCLRLIRALAVEIHEGWLETHCYLNMEPLAEQKKSQLHGLELAAA